MGICKFAVAAVAVAASITSAYAEDKKEAVLISGVHIQRGTHVEHILKDGTRSKATVDRTQKDRALRFDALAELKEENTIDVFLPKPKDGVVLAVVINGKTCRDGIPCDVLENKYEGTERLRFLLEEGENEVAVVVIKND